MAHKRYGQDEEIAGMGDCLASPEAAWIAGASLTVDDGFAG